MIDLRSQVGFGTVEVLDSCDVGGSLLRHWESFRHSFGDVPCTRVTTVNLLVMLPEPEDGQGLGELMHDLLCHHPGRALVTVLDADGEGELEGWICHCHSCNRPNQLCGEQLIFRCPGSPDRLPSLLLPLLVPGLPTFLWWRGDPPFGSDLLERLIETSIRVIFDSSRFGLSGGLLQLERLVRDPYHLEQAFSDLAWGRLAQVRERVAALYDGPGGLEELAGLNEVLVETAGKKPTTEALYLLGWLAARLRWRIERPLRSEGRAWVSTLTGPHGSITVRIAPGWCEKGFLRVKMSGQVVEQELLKGVDLVARELCLLSRETIFEEALAKALVLTGDREAVARG